MQDDNGNAAFVDASAEPTPSAIVETLQGAERDEWLKTGELPDREAEKAAADAGKDAAEEKVETKFQPAPKKEATDKSKPGQMSYRQLRDRVAELEAETTKLKTGTKTDDPPPAKDSPAPKTEEPAKTEELRAKPDPTEKGADGQLKYKTYEDYVEDLAAWRTEKTLADRDTAKAATAKKDAEKAEVQTAIDGWNNGVTEARKKYADFDTVALDKSLVIPPGSNVESWILRSPEIGPDLLYYLAKNDKDRIARINAMGPVQAARELVLVEAEMSEADDEPPPAEKDKTGKKVSSAPPPARELGNRSATSVDVVADALSEGDFERYRDAANAAELKSKKR